MVGDFLYDLAWLCFWQPWYPAWQRIDFEQEARRHYDAIGLDVPHFEERLCCCQLHIGLAGHGIPGLCRRLGQPGCHGAACPCASQGLFLYIFQLLSNEFQEFS